MQSVSKEDLNQFKYLRTIPYQTYKNVCRKVLIGLNKDYVCNPLKSVDGSSADLIASKTRLGWVIHSGNSSSAENTVGYYNIEHCSCDLEMEKLEKIVSEYLSLEDTRKKYNLVSPADERAETGFL